MWKCLKCGLEKAEKFTWAHKPADSGRRTCGGTPVEVKT